MATSRYGGPFTPTRGDHAGTTYPSYFAYRDQLARDKGFTSYYEERHAPKWREVGGDAIDRRASYRQLGSEEGKVLGAWALKQIANEMSAQYPDDVSIQLAVYGTWPNYGAGGGAVEKWQTTNIYAHTLRVYARESRDMYELMTRIFDSTYAPTGVKAISHRQR